MYTWRKLSLEQREELLQYRIDRQMPLHSPPHYEAPGRQTYHLTAANFNHGTIVGAAPERMRDFAESLIGELSQPDMELFAWCLLPNHWHALVGLHELKPLLERIRKLHGRFSFRWNGEDDARGRQCWHGCADRRIRSQRHFYAARNYIHHNPVKHGFVANWCEWPYSSARQFLDDIGRVEAARLWRDFPPLDMGKKWD